MITVESLKVTPVKIGQVLVTWSFSQTLENFNDYTFELQRSESPEDGYLTIGYLTDETFFLDDVNYVKLWKNLYWRMVISNKITGEIWLSEPATIGYMPNAEAVEIVRRLDILLSNPRHGIGIPCLAFIRKTSGNSCECWDSEKRKLRKSNCDSCYGTHFENGFYSPIKIWVNFTPDTKSAPITEWGETEPNEARVLVSNYPLLNPKDIIFDPVNVRMYLVNDVSISSRRSYVLHQMLSLGYLDRTSSTYQLQEKYSDVIKKLVNDANSLKLRG